MPASAAVLLRFNMLPHSLLLALLTLTQSPILSRPDSLSVCLGWVSCCFPLPCLCARGRGHQVSHCWHLPPHSLCITSSSSRADSLSVYLNWISCCTPLPPLCACESSILPLPLYATEAWSLEPRLSMLHLQYIGYCQGKY